MKTTRFGVGAWLVDPALGELRSGDEIRSLPRQQMRLLEFLAAHAGEVLTLDEILAAVWSGRVVSENAIYWNINQLRKALDDDGEHYVQTVTKRGYRLVAEVRPGGLLPAVRRLPIALGIAILAAVALGLLWLRPPEPAQPLSLAVLPFQNYGDLDDGDRFVDGITEEVLQAVAGIDSLQVTARSSSFYFKGRSTPIREIAGMLNVTHVIEGSVRGSPEQLRISVQLIDAADGVQVWSRSYDRRYANALDIQHDIALDVATALNVTPARSPADAADPSRPVVPEAAALTLAAGRIAADRSLPVDQRMQEERNQLRAALRYDRNYVPALRALANNHLHQIALLGGPFDEHLEAASRLLEALAERRQEDTWEYQAMFALKNRFELSGWGYTDDRLARTRLAYERAVTLRPNGAEPLLSYAVFLRRIGDLEGAMTLLTRAMRLDPLNPGVIGQYARVLSATEGLDAALEPLERLRQLRPEDPQSYLKKAGILASFGRFDESLQALLDSPYGDGNEVLQYHLRCVSLAMGNLDDAVFWLRRSPARPTEVALIPGLLGDWDAAFSAVEIALQNMRAPIDADNERAGDAAFLTGRYQTARHYYQASATELRPGAWRLTKQNYRRGLKLAAAMQKVGERESALELLAAIDSWLDGHYALGYEGYATTRAELLALRGDKRGALAELRALFNNGWRQLSGPWTNTWYGQESPHFAGLTGNAEFRELQQEAAQAQSGQRPGPAYQRARAGTGQGGLPTVAEFLAFNGRGGSSPGVPGPASGSAQSTGTR